MDDDTRALLIAAAPGLLEAGASGGLQLMGADPLSSALIGAGMGTALALDQFGIRKRALRTERVVDEAAAAVGSEVELVRAAIADEAHLEFTMQVLTAAAETTYGDKLRALSKVLARGLSDDRIDESRIYAGVLAEVEEPQALLLLDMARHDTPDGFFDPNPDPEDLKLYRPGWLAWHVMRRMNVSTGVAHALLSVLERQALIEPAHWRHTVHGLPDEPPNSPPRWAASELSYEILELLDAEIWGDILDKTED